MADINKEIRDLIKSIDKLAGFIKGSTTNGNSGTNITHGGSQQGKSAASNNDVLKEKLKVQLEINKAVERGSISTKKGEEISKRLLSIERSIARARVNYAKSLNEGDDKKRLATQARLLKLEEKHLDTLKQTNEELEDSEKSRIKSNEIIARGLNKIQSIATRTVKTFFEQDQALRDASTSIGLNERGYRAFGNTVSDVIGEGGLAQIGLKMSDIATMQSSYSESIGRTVMMTKEQVESMGYLAKGTILGVEGASELASEMDMVGVNTQGTSDITDSMLNKARKFGVSGAAATKALLKNMKIAQQYNFAGGRKALEEMAVLSAKFGLNMASIGAMSDKAFNVEGAVDMAAQMNVLGGGFAKMGDWSNLLYKSREDVQGLGEDIIQSMENYAHWDPVKQMYRTNAIEKQRATEAAKALGISFEELNKIGLKAGLIRDAKNEIRGLSDEAQDLFSGMATRNKDGEFEIKMVDTGEVVALKNVTEEMARAIKDDNKNLEERAKLATGFDTAWNSLQETLAASLYPALAEMVPGLKILITDVIAPAIVNIGKIVSSAVSLLGPTGLAAVAGLFGAAKWAANGAIFGNIAGNIIGSKISMAAMSGRGGGGGMIGGIKNNLGKYGAKGGIMSIAGAGAGMLHSSLKNNGTIDSGSGVDYAMGIGSSALTGAGMGLMFGGPMGALAGGLIGGAMGAYNTYSQNNGQVNTMDDGIVRADGSVTKINSADDVIALKPGGPVDNVFSGGGATNGQIALSPLKLEGNINLSYNGENMSDLKASLFNDTSFIQELTSLIHQETRKSTNGGSLQPAALK